MLVLAAMIAVALGIRSGESGIAGCGDGCQSVLGTRWAAWFGIPVGFLGAASYLAVLVLGWRGIRSNRHAVGAAAASGVVVGAALWFVAVQALVIGEFCPWCCGAHALAVLGVAALWFGGCRALAGSWWALAAGGAIAALALAGNSAFGDIGSGEGADQFFVRSLDGESPPGSGAATIAASTGAGGDGDLPAGRVMVGDVEIAIARFPTIGKVPSRHYIYALSDFTCSHCRHLGERLEELAGGYAPGDLGIVLLPVSRSDLSRQIHSVMQAVWDSDPAAYFALRRKIDSGEIGALPAAVRTAAESILGREKIAERLAAAAGEAAGDPPEPDQLLAFCQKRTGTRNVPQVIIGSQALVGVASVKTFEDLISRELGVSPSKAGRLALASPAPIRLGEIAGGGERRARIDLVNQGSGEVALASAEVPAPSRVEPWERGEISPSKSVAVEVIAAVPPEPGPFSIPVKFADSRGNLVRAIIEGTSHSLFIVDPPRLDLGTIRPAQVPEMARCTIRGASQPVVVTEAASPLVGAEVSFKPVPGDAGAWELAVAFHQPLPEGKIHSQLALKIRTENEGRGPVDFTIPVVGEVAPPIRVTPTAFSIPPSTDLTMRQVVLEAPGNPNINASAISVEFPPEVQGTAQVHPLSNEGAFRLILQLSPTQPLPRGGVSITVKTGVPEFPEAKVTVLESTD